MKTGFTLGVAPLLLALTPPTASELRSAIGPMVTLENGKAATLKGRTDGEDVVANLRLGDRGEIAAASVTQGARDLKLPASALQGVQGAQHAWLEERGALTTLVVEGTTSGGDWRLALVFHTKQLWLRRLSLRETRKESFIYYDRDDLTPQKEQHRATLNRDLHK